MVFNVGLILSSLLRSTSLPKRKAAGMQPFNSVRDSSGALAFGGGAHFLRTIRRGERDLSIDEFEDLSNDHITASPQLPANAQRVARATPSQFYARHAMSVANPF